MRSIEADNKKLCWLLGNYMRGETAMETPGRRSRLWVARQMVGIDNNQGLWQWGKHWRGRCLEAGLDPETFEVTDSELFNSWWASYEAEYQELKRLQRERVAKRKEAAESLNGTSPPNVAGSSTKALDQGVAIFKLPRFK